MSFQWIPHCGSLRWVPFLEMAGVLAQRMDGVRMHDLCQLANAYRNLQERDVPLFQAIVEAALRQIPYFDSF